MFYKLVMLSLEQPLQMDSKTQSVNVFRFAKTHSGPTTIYLQPVISHVHYKYIKCIQFYLFLNFKLVFMINSLSLMILSHQR